jgi:hypothetical protein
MSMRMLGKEEEGKALAVPALPATVWITCGQVGAPIVLGDEDDAARWLCDHPDWRMWRADQIQEMTLAPPAAPRLVPREG